MSRQVFRGMASFAVMLTLAACAKSGSPAVSQVSLNKVNAGIVNGKNADGTEAWAGSVIGIGVKNGKGFEIYCSGTLIDQKTIVTAAHCLDGFSGDNYVVFGLNENGTAVQGRRITNHKIHENYNSWFPDDARDVFDIGLAQFEGGMPTGFRPLEILPDDSILQVGADVTLAGFGVTNGHWQTGSGILRYTSVKVAELYGTSEIRTDETKSGSCNGDSGGPGLVQYNGRYYVWGTTSRGDSGCEQEGVYTKVTFYRDWIKTTVAGW